MKLVERTFREKIEYLLIEWLSARWDTGLYEEEAKGLYTNQILALFRTEMLRIIGEDEFPQKGWSTPEEDIRNQLRAELRKKVEQALREGVEK